MDRRLDGRYALSKGLIEFRRSHRRAVNPSRPGLRANVNYRVTHSLGLAVKIFSHAAQSKRKRIYQRIERITVGKVGLSADRCALRMQSRSRRFPSHTADDAPVCAQTIALRLCVTSASRIGPKRRLFIAANRRAHPYEDILRMPPTPVAAP